MLKPSNFKQKIVAPTPIIGGRALAGKASPIAIPAALGIAEYDSENLDKIKQTRP